uniref:Uncharacterized protein n=1 Tax=Sphaerodactylus townsendi TaxID=933632 RepID=A0ACB8G9Y1_9SAUR
MGTGLVGMQRTGLMADMERLERITSLIYEKFRYYRRGQPRQTAPTPAANALRCGVCGYERSRIQALLGHKAHKSVALRLGFPVRKVERSGLEMA